MERIILDYYDKDTKQLWDLDAESLDTRRFNKKILAVNNMYGWLYEQGILRELSFKFKDYSDMAYFALDVKDLERYREMMVNSGVEDAELAVHHIFDEAYSPCLYSGAIQLSWLMMTYRDFDGTVGRSWECGLVKGLNSLTVLDIEQTKNEKGVKAATEMAFDLYGFVPDRFDRACEYFKDWIDVDDKETREYLYGQAEKFIYCYEHKKDMIDFDFWCRYEYLVGENLPTWEEYVAIDGSFDGDPHDIELTDVEIVEGFKKALELFRQGKDAVYSPDDICIGDFRIFNTHGNDSDLNSRSGHVVEVLRELTEDEVDADDVGLMYKVRFIDGFECDAFADELDVKVVERNVSLEEQIKSTFKQKVEPLQKSNKTEPER